MPVNNRTVVPFFFLLVRQDRVALYFDNRNNSLFINPSIRDNVHFRNITPTKMRVINYLLLKMNVKLSTKRY